MKLNKHGFIVAALCGTALTASAWYSTENTIWLDGSIKGNVADNLSLKLTEQLRFKDEGRLLNYRYTDIGTTYSFAPAWSITPAWRHIQTRKTASADWSDKNMWHINLNNKTRLAAMDLKSRLRFTYTDDLSDFRPEFTLLPHKGFTGWKFKPFVTDELMYNFNEELFYRNRFSAGILCAPTKALSLKTFIMQELTKKAANGNWNESYNMGIYIGYAF